MSKTPQATLKKKNKISILKEILYNGALSKAELASTLNSTKTTISKNANELIEDNLLLEIGKGTNSVGKKGTLLDINPSLFHFVVISLSGSQFNLNIYNLKDEILYSVSLPLPNINEVENILEKTITKYSSFNLITTVTMAIPGVVKKGIVVSNNEIYVNIYKVINEFAINNKLKLLVHNDIDLQAEYLYANHLKSQNHNFILVGATYGIGSSIFYKGKLLTGSNHFAGEIAFTNPRLINGEIEDLEKRCSIGGLQKKYFEKYNVFLKLEELIEEIKEGDEFLNNLIDQMIDELAIIIVNMSYILDIKEIYLSGNLFDLRDDIVHKITQNILDFTKGEANVKYIPLHNKCIDGSLLVIKREILKLV
ncbi:MAG: ROK family transcriptional regulator [Lachnospirales bacterium]